MIRNPIISGFYPDPSICKAGKDYFLVTSSFEYFPGVPIFHSVDMINWKQYGHVLTRKKQLPLENCPRPLGIFAPTIRHINGRFYMVTTNMSLSPKNEFYGNFYVWTDDIEAGWSDPIWVDVGGIDPDLFCDDDGTFYFTSADGNSSILQAAVDIASGQVLSDVQQITRGTGGRHAEAPHIYKVDSTYYLMLAEGGTEEGHMVTILRGSSPRGPWTECRDNPILSHRSKPSPIRATGHADMIEGPNGQWWMVFLGIRPTPDLEVHYLGRETFVAPVDWDDGWPVVNGGDPVPQNLTMADAPKSTHIWGSEKDEFGEQTLGLKWNYLRNPDHCLYDLTTRPGWLGLKCGPVTIDEPLSPAWIGQRLCHFNMYAEVLLDFDPCREGDTAGLTAYMCETHHYDVYITLRNGDRMLGARRRVGSISREEQHAVAIGKEPTRLFVEVKDHWFALGFRSANGEKRVLARGEASLLSKEVAGGFTGVYLAMFAQGTGSADAASTAWFDYFDYQIV